MNTARLRTLLALILPMLQPLAGGFSAITGWGQSIGAMSAASQTPVTPAGYAFIIWTPLFLLMIVWGIWQALPAGRNTPQARKLDWPLAAAAALNCLWMILAQTTGNGWHLVIVMAGVLAVSLTAFWAERRYLAGEDGAIRRWVTAPLTGVLAGWVSAAFFANLASAAKVTGLFPMGGWPESLAAALVILAAGGFAAAVLTFGRGSLWYAAGAAWALLAIVVANLPGQVVVALVAAAMMALVGAIAVRERARALP
ncbi:hypothetical protein IAI18_03865 [Acetobacteraceae bacterium H6797]|nr:hypothetical protein [Acetobacteraceae bacterium H6797]